MDLTKVTFGDKKNALDAITCPENQAKQQNYPHLTQRSQPDKTSLRGMERLTTYMTVRWASGCNNTPSSTVNTSFSHLIYKTYRSYSFSNSKRSQFELSRAGTKI